MESTSESWEGDTFTRQATRQATETHVETTSTGYSKQTTTQVEECPLLQPALPGMILCGKGVFL